MFEEFMKYLKKKIKLEVIGIFFKKYYVLCFIMNRLNKHFSIFLCRVRKKDLMFQKYVQVSFKS